MSSVIFEIYSKDIHNRLQKYGVLPFSTEVYSIGFLNDAFLNNELISASYEKDLFSITFFELQGNQSFIKAQYSDYQSVLHLIQSVLRFDVVKTIDPQSIKKIDVIFDMDYENINQHNYLIDKEHSNKPYTVYQKETISALEKKQEEQLQIISKKIDKLSKKREKNKRSFLLHKLSVLFENVSNIYGNCNKRIRRVFRIIKSIILLPIYLLLVIIIVIHTIYMWILYLPFTFAKIIVGDHNIHQDPIFSIVALPFGIIYFGSYILLFLPYLFVALLCDIIAELISKRNHRLDYVIIMASVTAVPHNTKVFH